MKLIVRNFLCLHTLLRNRLSPRKIIWDAICVSIVLVCVWIGNIFWAPVVQRLNIFLGDPIVEIHTLPCKYPNNCINFGLAVTSYIDEQYCLELS